MGRYKKLTLLHSNDMHGDFSAQKLNFIGIICGLMSGVSYSLYTVIGRVALKKYDSTTNSITCRRKPDKKCKKP